MRQKRPAEKTSTKKGGFCLHGGNVAEADGSRVLCLNCGAKVKMKFLPDSATLVAGKMTTAAA